MPKRSKKDTIWASHARSTIVVGQPNWGEIRPRRKGAPSSQPYASLDLGCGVGSDMIRYAQLGWQPSGVDLSKRAVEYVKGLGFPAQVADMRDALPFEEERLSLVTGRCSLHFFPKSEARFLFTEIRRVLEPGGKLLFVVNSERHRKQGLQYDYTGARWLEDNYWELPVIGRRYLFYTPELARELLESSWKIHHLAERPFRQWGIEKRVLTCLAERVGEDE